jgi:hypothetical protein
MKMNRFRNGSEEVQKGFKVQGFKVQKV